MKRLSLDDYIFDMRSKDTAPFYNPNEVELIMKEIPDFIKEDSFQEILGRTCSMLYGDYLLRTKYALNPAKIWIDVMNLYAYNAYKYLGLYNTTQLEYNPINNYDMVEQGHDETENSHNSTTNYGEQQNTINEGSRNDNVQHGQHTDTDNTPSITNTQQGATSPYDTNTYYNTNRQTDTLGAINKTLQYGQYTDTSTKGEMTTTGTNGAHTDSTNGGNENKYTHYLERSGNVGVTTSQQMVLSEREVRDFSIYNTIAKDIMCILCIRIEQPKRYIIIR